VLETRTPGAAQALSPDNATSLAPHGIQLVKNPCNPCQGKHISPARFMQPAGSQLSGGNRRALIAQGEKLWNDRTLGKSGLACARVERLSSRSPSVGNLDESVQFSRIGPMAQQFKRGIQ